MAQCVEPCTRTVYEPLASNAALSSLSIESILRKDDGVLKKKFAVGVLCLLTV